MDTLVQVLQKGNTTAENALYIFDSLEPIEADFMIGTWKGSEFPTGHSMDGLLKLSGWYGKQFVARERVHPLLFYNSDKTELFPVNPHLIPAPILNKYPKTKALHRLLLLARPLLQTKAPKARLRMVELRGKTSASLIYDDKPIIDCFRKIDDNRVLGVMDLRDLPEPFFFMLERDEPSIPIIA